MKKNAFYFIMTFIMVQMSYAVNLSDYAVIKGTIAIPDLKTKEITLTMLKKESQLLRLPQKLILWGSLAF